MKTTIALVIALLIGVGCRWFEIPVPSPPKLIGALLVLTMTVGYLATDQLIARSHGAPHRRSSAPLDKGRRFSRATEVCSARMPRHLFLTLTLLARNFLGSGEAKCDRQSTALLFEGEERGWRRGSCIGWLQINSWLAS